MDLKTLTYKPCNPSWLGSCFEILLPRECLVCSRPLRGTSLCYRCRPALPDLRSILTVRCSRCFEPLSSTTQDVCDPCLLHPCIPDSIRFLWEYEGLARDFIRTMKYRPSITLLDIAANLLLQATPHLFAERNWDALVPIPSSHRQLKKRLLHPCVELSRDISRNYSIPIVAALRHNKHRAPQATLSREKRLSGLGNLFRVNHPKRVAGKSILLIEDVITTGATVSAATRALQEYGALRVDVLALARTSVWKRFRARLNQVFKTSATVL